MAAFAAGFSVESISLATFRASLCKEGWNADSDDEGDDANHDDNVPRARHLRHPSGSINWFIEVFARR